MRWNLPLLGLSPNTRWNSRDSQPTIRETSQGAPIKSVLLTVPEWIGPTLCWSVSSDCGSGTAEQRRGGGRLLKVGVQLRRLPDWTGISGPIVERRKLINKRFVLVDSYCVPFRYPIFATNLIHYFFPRRIKALTSTKFPVSSANKVFTTFFISCC
jgi:hypothetical protein